MSNKNLSKFFILVITMLVLLLPMGVAFAQDDGGSSFSPIYCVSGIIGIALAFWTYQDANKRGANAILWGAVVFFFGLIGFAVYWFVGRKD